MDWDDLRHFLALARTGSVRSAGASLGVSHSTVSRRIDALETQLCARLFDRTRDGFTLTEAGHRMLPTAERVERELAALERGLVGQDGRLEGAVSLTCCDDYVSDLLIQGLAPWVAQQPAIDLRVHTDSRPFDLGNREADIAVRTLARGAQPPEHLIGRRLVPVVVATYVARAHAERLDPTDPATRCIAFSDLKTTRALIAASTTPNLQPWGGFSSLPALLQATRAGMGVCFLPTYVGDADPALLRVPQSTGRHLADLWLLCHTDLRDNARFRAARALVAETLISHRALFEGAGPSLHPPVANSHQMDAPPRS
jgi:DNA-binding transcriptional LysR family regulator